MELVKTYSGAVYGIKAQRITIEVGVSAGIRYYIVGLPDIAVKESLQRIESALFSSGFKMPRKKIVINLAPAYLRKEGSAFDLAIALGVLAASRQFDSKILDGILFLGELSLAGNLLPVRGVLPMTLLARQQGLQAIVVPHANVSEASVVEGIRVYGMRNLSELVQFLKTPVGMRPEQPKFKENSFSDTVVLPELDFSDVKGQSSVKRALEIAAAGGHNILLVGPPGSGKSMLAGLFPTILPALELDEALETTQIYSVAGKLALGHSLQRFRPFRTPHHTVTLSALVGGGSHPQPGEVSLAHHGVLFLDELTEFKRSVLEGLRQPLEQHKISIGRLWQNVEFPADFTLVAAMNPCPCGYLNHPARNCLCGSHAVQQYIGRISGPLLDRIDMHIEIVPVPFEELSQPLLSESSEQIRVRVTNARKVQKRRLRGVYSRTNARMNHRQVQQFCKADADTMKLMQHAMEQLHLSARAYERTLKVARTIADLAGSGAIAAPHLAEALQYRSLDRGNWAG